MPPLEPLDDSEHGDLVLTESEGEEQDVLTEESEEEELDPDDSWLEASKTSKILKEEKKADSHIVYCPDFPLETQEWWWVFLADKSSNHMVSIPPKKVLDLKDEQVVDFKVQLPQGKFTWQLGAVSDSYIGADTFVNIIVRASNSSCTPPTPPPPPPPCYLCLSSPVSRPLHVRGRAGLLLDSRAHTHTMTVYSRLLPRPAVRNPHTCTWGPRSWMLVRPQRRSRHSFKKRSLSRRRSRKRRARRTIESLSPFVSCNTPCMLASAVGRTLSPCLQAV